MTANGGADARRWLPDPGGNPALDRIAGLAARLLGVASAQVSLLTDVQTIAGGAGLEPGAVGSRGPLADSLCTVTAAQGAPLVVTRAAQDERVSRLPPVSTGQVGAYLGVPLRSDAGAVVGALCAYDPTPRSWSHGDVTVLEHLAESVQAELELQALSRESDSFRTRLDLAVQAGDIGSFDWDLVSGELEWDDRLIAMYGYDAGDVRFDRSIDSVYARLHPEDADMVGDVMATAIADVAPLQVLYRIVVPGSGTRWLEARGRALAGPDGVATRLIGVSWDVTEQYEAETRAERVLSSMSVGYLSTDRDRRITYVNTEGRRLLGAAPSELLGGLLWDLFPAAVDTEFGDTYRRVVATGAEETIEAFYPAPLNAWYEIRMVSEADGVAIYLLDITARRESEQLLQLSVDVSEHMVGAVSVDAAVGALARLVVPVLADWTIVTLVDPDGHVRDVQNWHADPALRPAVQRYSATRLENGGSGVIDEVIARHEPVVVPSDVVAFGVQRLGSAVARVALQELGPESAVAVPMIAGSDTTGEDVAGVLTLCRGPGRPPMAPHEIDVVISLCRRAGLAVDNARLYLAQAAAADHDRTVAQALQQALLSSLPEPDHLHLTARYLPAADGDQVGGDWYDAVVAPDGATTVMIGDVVGHDIRAAALMGQLRTMLRMLALQYRWAPSRIMDRLDRSVADLRLRTMASVLMARIEQTDADREAGVRTLRWTNAGHPPPILLLADGSTEVLEGPRSDLLVGVAPDQQRHDHVRVLPPDSTLLLYTDGLVERRTAPLDDGIAHVREVLSRHHTKTPDDLLDAVLAETVGAHRDDDVAVLAVRFNREDHPRPPEAGPERV